MADSNQNLLAQPEPLLLKPREVAVRLGIGKTKVYEMLQQGQLPQIRIRGSRRVPLQALLTWIEQNTQAGPSSR
jgi:excisionase family DNA binding protein